MVGWRVNPNQGCLDFPIKTRKVHGHLLTHHVRCEPLWLPEQASTAAKGRGSASNHNLSMAGLLWKWGQAPLSPDIIVLLHPLPNVAPVYLTMF